ncbi:MAG: hypothetical protein HN677_00990 [Flavobacteriales bacterium]|nr:hypothetical protein [Flavobacteriales bacterium]
MFGITTELSIYYSIICILLGVVYAYFLYRKNNFESKTLTSVLFVFRALVVSVLSFLLLNPLTNILETTEEKPIVILAQDASVSCQESEDFIKFTKLQQSLSENFDVFVYNYSDELREGFVSEKKGVSTNISKLMDEVDLKFSGRNLLGVVLSSDGLYNDGSNPLYHKISKSIPFYTIPLGDTSVIKDVRISDVLHNEISFLGNTSPIEVQIQTEKCRGENITVKLYHQSKLIASKKVKVKTDNEYIKVPFVIENNFVGLQKYRVEVGSVSQENNTANNSYKLFVEVLDSRYKILFLSDVSHPDISAIKSVLEKNKNYELEIESTSDFTKNIENYNLIVLFHLNSRKTNVIEKIKESDVSLLMISNSINTSLISQIYNGFSVKGKSKSQEITTEMNTTFSKFSISPSLRNYIQDLPPLHSPFGIYNYPASAEVLLYQKIGMYTTEKPFVLLDQSQNRKIGLILGEGLWKWKINDRKEGEFHKNFEELISKITQYLLINEDKSRFRIFHDKKILEGKSIVFKAEYYNENYELTNTKEVSQKVFNEKGEEFRFVYSKNQNTYFLDLGNLAVGTYTFKSAYAENLDVKEGSFTVVPKQLEGNIIRANHQILYQLSKESNAVMFPEFNIENIINQFNESPLNKTVLHTSKKTTSVINKSWILILLLSLLSGEWFARKFNGFY